MRVLSSVLFSSFVDELEKIAAAKQLLTVGKLRIHARPLRVETLLRKEKEGTLWKTGSSVGNLVYTAEGNPKAEEGLQRPAKYDRDPTTEIPTREDSRDHVSVLPLLSQFSQAPVPSEDVPITKRATALGAVGRRIARHLHKYEAPYEIAGLGTLGAIGADRIQAHARAGAGASEDAIESKQLLGGTGHAVVDIAGLGMLAAPIVAQRALTGRWA